MKSLTTSSFLAGLDYFFVSGFFSSSLSLELELSEDSDSCFLLCFFFTTYCLKPLFCKAFFVLLFWTKVLNTHIIFILNKIKHEHNYIFPAQMVGAKLQEQCDRRPDPILGF